MTRVFKEKTLILLNYVWLNYYIFISYFTLLNYVEYQALSSLSSRKYMFTAQRYNEKEVHCIKPWWRQSCLYFAWADINSFQLFWLRLILNWDTWFHLISLFLIITRYLRHSVTGKTGVNNAAFTCSDD